MVLERPVTQQVLTFLSPSLTNSPLFPTLTPLSAEQNKCSTVTLSPLHCLIASYAEQEFPASVKTSPTMEMRSPTPITFLEEREKKAFPFFPYGPGTIYTGFN